MSSIIFQTERTWEKIQEPEKVQTFLGGKLKNRALILKNSQPHMAFFQKGNTEKGILFQFPPEYKPTPTLVLFTTGSRHVEIDMKLENALGNGRAVLQPLQVRIAKTNRLNPRVYVENNELLIANFRFDKEGGQTDNTRSNVQHQVIFREFERQLAADFPGVKIYEYADKNRPQETQYLENSSSGILVENVLKQESYQSAGPGFLDYYANLLADELFEQTKERYLKEHVNSVMTLPIIYKMPGDKPKIIAFIHCESKRQKLNTISYKKWKQVSSQITNRIRDANALVFPKKHRVINLSEGGLAAALNDADLRKHLSTEKYVLFDLLYLNKEPFLVEGLPCYMQEVKGSYVTGLTLRSTDPEKKDLLKEYLFTIMKDLIIKRRDAIEKELSKATNKIPDVKK